MMAIDKIMQTIRDKPETERVRMLTRLFANFLHKRGKLPDHLKKYTDN
jgi:hypothetical protein